MNLLKESAECALCAASPIYFLLKYAKIKTSEGFSPFRLFLYQIKLLLVLVSSRLVIILKNRQIGCTWLIAGYALWKAFKKGANVIIVSKGGPQAEEVLDYCRFIYNNLPDYVKPKIDSDRTSFISFPGIGSKIRALSATTTSGIGFGMATLVIMDEFDFHPYDEENYVEIKPMIDAGTNQQLVILSAPNRLRLNSKFKQLWRDAKTKENNFVPVFLPFGSVPYHTEEWYDNVSKDYDLRDMETRYFKTEDEALSVTVAGRFFDADKLLLMYNRVCSPIDNYDGIDTRHGVIKIFKPPLPSNNQYCLFTDPSEGKEDPFHLVVVDGATGEEVSNAHGRMPADEVALIHDTLARHYNAHHSYFRTGYSGGIFHTALEKLGTPKQMCSRSTDGKPQIGKYGYWESNPLKKDLLGKLRDWVFFQQGIIHDAPTLDEFAMLIWMEGSEIPQVPDKEHDDRITAWMGVLDLIKRIPRTQAKIVTHLMKPDGSYG